MDYLSIQQARPALANASDGESALFEYYPRNVSEPLSASIPRLVKKKQIDPTLGQLLVKVSEILDKSAHGISITANDAEQLTHFMPIIRSALKDAVPVQHSQLSGQNAR